MQQKIITGTCFYDFKLEVQKHLDQGWQVVPGTLSTVYHQNPEYLAKEHYVVFLQKANE